MRLLYLVEPALRAVGKCLHASDKNIVLKAAQILLDRAGFHPTATLEVKQSDNAQDLANLSTQDIRKRAQRLIQYLDQAPPDDDGLPPEPQQLEPMQDLAPDDPLNIIIDMEAEEPDPNGSVH